MKFKKVLSFALALILAFQAVGIGVSAVSSSITKNGRVFAVINTNYLSDSSITFTTYSEDAPEYEPEEELQGASADVRNQGDVIDGFKFSSQSEYENAVESLKKQCKTKSKGYKVGDKKKFGMNYYSSERTLQCGYVGEYCTVWYQLDSDEIDYENIEKTCKETAEFADEKIPQELELLGDCRIDTDGDGKIAIYIEDMLGVGGYFSSSDFFRTVLSDLRGVYCDCIHVCPDYSINEYMGSIIVHEYQHYINFSYSVLNSGSRYSFGITYLEEAFSTSMEYVLNDDSLRYFNILNTYQDNDVSLTASAYDNHSYELSFIFGQYIRTRYAALIGDKSADKPGKGIYKLFLEKRGTVNGFEELEVLADILYPAEKYPELKNSGERSKKLIEDFWLAMLLNEPTGDHGFNGDKLFEDCSFGNGFDTLYNSQEIELRSGMAQFFMTEDDNDTELTIESKSDNLSVIPIEDRFYKLTLKSTNSDFDDELIYYTESYNLYNRSDYFEKKGYKLIGWSYEDGATEPDFGVNDTIFISENTTLYTVFENASIPIEMNHEYSAEDSDFFVFSPDESGYYSINGDLNLTVWNKNPDYDAIRNEDECLPSYNYESGRTFYFEKSKDYLICYAEDPFTVTKETDQHTLTIVYGDDTFVFGGRNEYYLYDCEMYILSGKNFKGFSKENNSDMIDYYFGDIVTLTGDTTLYAVYGPEIELHEGENIIPAYATSLVFNPPSNGKYVFEAEYEKEYNFWLIGNNFYNARGSKEFETGLLKDKPVSITLSYYDCYLSGSEHKIKIKSVDPEFCPTLYMEVLNYISLLNVELYGRTTYVIPDIEPFSESGQEFDHWESTGDVYSEPGEYYPGDTIEIAEDTVLVPVWKEGTGKSVPYLKASINGILYLFRILVWVMTHLRTVDPEIFKLF